MTKPLLDTLPRRLAYARTKAGLSLDAASRVLPLAQGLVEAHENGTWPLHDGMLERYAVCYGVTVDWLEGYVKEPRAVRGLR